MKLNSESLKNKDQWQEAGINIPAFDREAMISKTKNTPVWVHFGAGNIFRAFPAILQQQLLNAGHATRGIVVAEGYDSEIIEKVFTPYDNLSMVVTLKANGTIDKTIMGSIAESLRMDDAAEFKRLKEIFESPSLQIATFTITEKGYSLTGRDGSFIPAVAEDMKTGPNNVSSYIGRVVASLYARYKAGKRPITMLSMDNCSHNGDKLAAAVQTFAAKWVENGVAEAGFKDYVNDRKFVSFPWSMIDKITPRPDDSVKDMLKSVGFEDTEGFVTTKNTYIAPFVNAEEAQYLVIEDDFPGGRPQLEKAGVLFTTRETVDKVEKMKVCTCLNPLHTALAVFGCLLGYTKISDEMKDAELVKLVEVVGYKEGLPVVVDPKIISPKSFIDEVLKVRVPNPFMPDTPQRIATDTSQKLSIRFGETIKAYQQSSSLNVADLKLIPLVLAGWLRYLTGIDDKGAAFEVSPDPLYESLKAQLKGLTLGGNVDKAVLKPILSDKTIFGVNLYEAGLGERVEGYLEELIKETGAVRKTLQKYLA
ncbi:MAG: mannitol dehydrogenase family protein [Deferribacteraceae bacterium]|jgi:fructuronate reductase|nr:mannitol dehydrogenase family protein [Deferribacteraceae bacterium]